MNPVLHEALVQAKEMGRIPVPAGDDKQPLIKGVGLEANGGMTEVPTEDQIRAWWRSWPDAQLAILTGYRSNLVVVDVDGPEGEAMLARLEIELGPLLPTLEVRTKHGRHLYFTHPGAGIKILTRRGGMFTSWSEDREPAQGVDVRGDGGLVIAPPSRDREYVNVRPMAGLGEGWIEALSTSATIAQNVDLDEARAWLTEGEPDQDVLQALEKYDGHRSTARALQVELLGLGRDGHAGTAAAMATLQDRFLADGGEARDWSRLLAGAPGHVQGVATLTIDDHLRRLGMTMETETTKEDDQGETIVYLAKDWRIFHVYRDQAAKFEELVGEHLATAEDWAAFLGMSHEDFQLLSVTAEDLGLKPPGLATLPDAFWSSREVLTKIRNAAHARGRSADLVLGAVLARISSMVDPGLRIDTGLGQPASLNLYVAIIGRSGIGKSTGAATARGVLQMPGYLTGTLHDHAQYRDGVPVGSGEGLIEAYMGTVLKETGELKKDGTPKWTRVREQVRRHVFVFVDEGQALTVQISRTGANLGPVLRSGWGCELLGQANAREETTRILEAGSYALGMVIGFQRTTAGPLLDDAGAGTPQRFLWFSATDPNVPDVPPEHPDPIYLIALNHVNLHDRPRQGVIKFAQEIREELWQTNLRRVRGEDDDGDQDLDLDSHVSLLRCKVAGLLAILDGRHKVTVEDWELAGQIHETSRAVREDLVQFRAEQTAKETEARTDAYVTRETRAQVARGQAETKVQRVAAHLGRKIHEKGTLTRREATKILASRDRGLFPEALDLAQSMEWLDVDEDGKKIAPGSSRPAES